MDTPKKIGRYEILEELGRGAMGTVYRAKDPAMDRVVALKTIISMVLATDHGGDFRERFYREARAAGSLTHPGIVPVFDVGEHEGSPFLVMEFISGKTLEDTVKKGERLSIDRVCELGQKIAEALGYAHQHGVVHRDIKPANILLTSMQAHGIERPKITDFGVAKLAVGHTTMTGQMVGTPAFMPPEQFTGAPIDGRADIFSLGVVLYWLATGEQPFPGESVTAVSYKVVHTEPVPPRKLNPSVPAKLEAIILKCLAKSPEERYATGEELARELGELRASGGLPGYKTAVPAATAVGTDPNETFVEKSMVAPAAPATAAPVAAAPIAAVPVAAPAPAQASSAPPPVAAKSNNTLLVAAAIIAVVAAGGWLVLRHKDSPVSQTASSAPSVPLETPPPTSVIPGTRKDSDQLAAPAPADNAANPPAAPATAASTAVPATAPKVSASSKPPASAAKKPDAKPADADKSPTPKVEASAPQPAAVDFDPKTLDPKNNAKLKIEADHVPVILDFTVEMNGKVYLQRSTESNKTEIDNLYVPPGVHEFRVTARSGSVQKSSNTVSTEFKAKKKHTLKVELRSQGSSAGIGVPQGLYADTQIVLTLK